MFILAGAEVNSQPLRLGGTPVLQNPSELPMQADSRAGSQAFLDGFSRPVMVSLDFLQSVATVYLNQVLRAEDCNGRLKRTFLPGCAPGDLRADPLPGDRHRFQQKH